MSMTEEIKATAHGIKAITFKQKAIRSTCRVCIVNFNCKDMTVSATAEILKYREVQFEDGGEYVSDTDAKREDVRCYSCTGVDMAVNVTGAKWNTEWELTYKVQYTPYILPPQLSDTSESRRSGLYKIESWLADNDLLTYGLKCTCYSGDSQKKDGGVIIRKTPLINEYIPNEDMAEKVGQNAIENAGKIKRGFTQKIIPNIKIKAGEVVKAICRQYNINDTVHIDTKEITLDEGGQDVTLGYAIS